MDKNKILEIVRNTIDQEDIKRSLIFWDKRIVKKGEKILIGTETRPLPFDGTIVFIDLAPRMNWAHPCLYLIVDTQTQQTEVIKASLPPRLSESDENNIIILRYGEEPPNEHDFNPFNT